MEETDKQIGKIVVNFYDTMKSLEKTSDFQEREGKKAVALVMAINDIKEIFNKPKEDETEKECLVPPEFKKYLTETFYKIAKSEGEIIKVPQYGGSIFAKFKNGNCYRMTIQKYNDSVTLD